jgi:BMFP domain-containing protein YqiC
MEVRRPLLVRPRGGVPTSSPVQSLRARASTWRAARDNRCLCKPKAPGRSGAPDETSTMDTTPPPDPSSSTPPSPRAFLRRAAEALENSPLKDVQRNVRALAHSAAGRLDLVTREEFDALQAMLNASAQRVAQLEAQVAALESHLAASEQRAAEQAAQAPAPRG